MRILVWLSWWVDSAVAAHLLIQQWHEVIAWFMKNYADELNPNCHTREDRNMALKVAQKLWIRTFIIFDFREQYQSRIIDYITSWYAAWLTPNPDVLCNNLVKFDLFLEEALKLWCDGVAMGHYARICRRWEDVSEDIEDIWIKKQDIDNKTYKIIGICMDIHNSFWNTLTEKQYEKIVTDMLKEAWFKVSTQVSIDIIHNNKTYWKRYIDIVVDNQIILEFKVLHREYTLKWWMKQTRSYMELWNYASALLIDFWWERLRYHRLNNNTLLSKSHISCELSPISSASSFHLLKNKTNKDQSYFLSWLSQHQLAHAHFPLGELTKPEVRQIAHDIGLPNADRKDSQWLCFIGKVSIKEFLSDVLPKKEWNIVDISWNILWHHDGAHFVTIGQRTGLWLSWWPRYVVHKDTTSNTITVSKDEHTDLSRTSLTATNRHRTSWNAPTLPYACTAKIRYRQEDQACVIQETDDAWVYLVSFDTPQRAISPGQIIVIYQWDEVMGNAVIQ